MSSHMEAKEAKKEGFDRFPLPVKYHTGGTIPLSLHKAKLGNAMVNYFLLLPTFQTLYFSGFYISWPFPIAAD